MFSVPAESPFGRWLRFDDCFDTHGGFVLHICTAGPCWEIADIRPRWNIMRAIATARASEVPRRLSTIAFRPHRVRENRALLSSNFKTRIAVVAAVTSDRRPVGPKSNTVRS